MMSPEFCGYHESKVLQMVSGEVFGNKSRGGHGRTNGTDPAPFGRQDLTAAAAPISVVSDTAERAGTVGET